MTEIPEHLRLRAEAHRSKRAPTATTTTTTPTTVPVPVDLLRKVDDYLNGRLNGLDTTLRDLVALIPEPPYAPDDGLINATARALAISPITARKILVELHDAGLEVTRPDA